MKLVELIITREYLLVDKDAVVNLTKLNTSGSFVAEGESDLSKYSEKEIEFYCVLLVDGQMVGCDGINFAENRVTGRISWDIIYPALRGKELGTRLLRHRISILRTIDSVQKTTVRTS